MPIRKKSKVKKKTPKKKVSRPKAKRRTAAKRATARRSAAKVSLPAAANTSAAAVSYPSSDNTRFWKRERYNTLREFWPFYLHEHRSSLNRVFHFIGSTLGVVVMISAFAIPKYWLILGAFVSGYAFAWIGHFFIEKNRPATFKYPLKSFISDWRLWYSVLTGRVYAEMKKFGIESK